MEWLLSVSDPETYGRVGPSAVCKGRLFIFTISAMCAQQYPNVDWFGELSLFRLVVCSPDGSVSVS